MHIKFDDCLAGVDAELAGQPMNRSPRRQPPSGRRIVTPRHAIEKLITHGISFRLDRRSSVETQLNVFKVLVEICRKFLEARKGPHHEMFEGTILDDLVTDTMLEVC